MPGNNVYQSANDKSKINELIKAVCEGISLILNIPRFTFRGFEMRGEPQYKDLRLEMSQE